MNKKYLIQDEFYTEIYDAVSNDNLSKVIDTYNNYYLKQKKSFFNSFLKVCGLAPPTLSLYSSFYPIEHACHLGRTEILDFLLQDKNLLADLDEKLQLHNLLAHAFSAGNIDTANVIIPHLKKERSPEDKEFYNTQFFTGLLYGLLGACENNKLNVVKYILNDKDLDFNVNSHLYSELELEERGSIPSRCLAALIYQNSLESLHYVLYELDDCISQPFKLEAHRYSELPALLKLKEYKELQVDLPSNTVSTQSSKKIKI